MTMDMAIQAPGFTSGAQYAITEATALSSQSASTFPHCVKDRNLPVLNTDQHDTSIKVRPPERETECRVDKARSKLKDRSTDGEVAAHLGDAQVARPDEEDAPDQVAQQQRQRARLGQGATDTNEEARSDGTSNGHELDVARRKTTFGLAVALLDSVGIEEDAMLRAAVLGGSSADARGVLFNVGMSAHCSDGRTPMSDVFKLDVKSGKKEEKKIVPRTMRLVGFASYEISVATVLSKYCSSFCYHPGR